MQKLTLNCFSLWLKLVVVEVLVWLLLLYSHKPELHTQYLMCSDFGNCSKFKLTLLGSCKKKHVAKCLQQLCYRLYGSEYTTYYISNVVTVMKEAGCMCAN